MKNKIELWTAINGGILSKTVLADRFKELDMITASNTAMRDILYQESDALSLSDNNKVGQIHLFGTNNILSHQSIENFEEMTKYNIKVNPSIKIKKSNIKRIVIPTRILNLLENYKERYKDIVNMNILTFNKHNHTYDYKKHKFICEHEHNFLVTGNYGVEIIDGKCIYCGDELENIIVSSLTLSENTNMLAMAFEKGLKKVLPPNAENTIPVLGNYAENFARMLTVKHDIEFDEGLCYFFDILFKLTDKNEVGPDVKFSIDYGNMTAFQTAAAIIKGESGSTANHLSHIYELRMPNFIKLYKKDIFDVIITYIKTIMKEEYYEQEIELMISSNKYYAFVPNINVTIAPISKKIAKKKIKGITVKQKTEKVPFYNKIANELCPTGTPHTFKNNVCTICGIKKDLSNINKVIKDYSAYLFGYVLEDEQSMTFNKVNIEENIKNIPVNPNIENIDEKHATELIKILLPKYASRIKKNISQFISKYLSYLISQQVLTVDSANKLINS